MNTLKIIKTSSITSFGNNQNKKPRVNYVKITGYGALASGVMCALTAKKRKPHKMYALIAGLLSLAHIGILESYKFKRSKSNNL